MTTELRDEVTIKLENLQFNDLFKLMTEMKNKMNWTSCPIRVENESLIFTTIEEDEDGE